MTRGQLLARYRELVLGELPRRARAGRWVVTADHCFGRIVLDHAVGGRWYDVLVRRRSPAYQDEVFIRCRRINATGVSIIMVEQNARRCLQICDRGYVLDQGRNAYTDTGRSLMTDPKVIELYLGTLAKAQ